MKNSYQRLWTRAMIFAIIIALHNFGAEMGAKERKRGRPPKTANKPRTAQLSTRFRADLKARLEKAAYANEPRRSLSDEIEQRLLASFEVEERTTIAFVHFAALALTEVERFTGQPWTSDLYTFRLAEAVWAKLFTCLRRPPGETKVPETILPVRALRGSSVAAATVRAETFARIAKEPPDIFAEGIVGNMVTRLRDAEAGSQHPHAKQMRYLVDQLNPKIFGEEHFSTEDV